MKKQDLGDKLIEVRKERGLTQEDVAKKCMITVRTIQRFESGEVMPRAYTIKVISERLGISFFETFNDNVKDKNQQSSCKNHTFYWYVKDLFNLKTNAMKKISILSTPFLLVGFALFFVLNPEINAQTNDYGSSLNNYSFNLYRNAKVEKENVFISPLSTYYALLMAYEGSINKTKQEFEEVLHIDNLGFVGKTYLHNIASNLDSCPSLNVSNAIWLDKNIVIEGEFSKDVSDRYLTDLEQTDFANSESVVSDINGWVSDKTNHKIKQIVSVLDIPTDTKLLISNAVCFDGEWLMKFNKQNTVSAPFFSSIEDQYKVDFMNMTESLHYFENDECQFISKPYRNSNLSLGIILPKNLFGIEEIEKKINNDFLNNILDSSFYIKTALSIPKFKMEFSCELSNVLQSMGLKTAFTSEADFSGITKDVPLQFVKILHKTEISLGEERTEAAAATAAVIRITGLHSHKIFNADHPFVFFIIDNQSKTILFMGRYVKPINGEKVENKSLMQNFNKRKQEKFEVGNVQIDPLYVVDKKIVSPAEFKAINPEDIESVKVIKDKERIAKYTLKKYNGVVIITTKRDK